MGRRVATLLFWCVALYVGVAGFYSITMQVFWPERTRWEASCADGVRSLESELLARAGEQVAAGGAMTDDADLRRWLDDWDARHATLHDRCEGSHRDALDAVEKLRIRVETMLRRSQREHTPLVRDIDEALRAEEARPL